MRRAPRPRCSSPRQVVLVASAVATGLGVLAMFVLLLQPWASCPEIEDTSAGCPVQDGVQLGVQSATMLVVVLGVIGLLGVLLITAMAWLRG